MPVSSSAMTFHQRLAPWKRSLELGYWLIGALVGAAFNTATVMLEHLRAGDGLPWWEPATWEASSSLAILALVPAVVAFTRRWPLHFDTWRRAWPQYVAASLVWSLLHVGLMVGVRKLTYAVLGHHYDFGDWPRELAYEYLKDVRTFAGIVLMIHAWRWLWLRLQGEARVLDSGDEAAEPANASARAPVDSAAPTSVDTASLAISRPSRFLVRKLDREFLIDADAIERAEACGNYVNLHVAGRVYPLRSTLAAFETQVDPSRFARVHRSHLVNLAHIASIEPTDSGDARVHLKNGEVVPCSRRYREALRASAR